MTKITMEQARKIRDEYLELPCYDARYYSTDKARELKVSRWLIRTIVTASRSYAYLAEREE